MSIIRNVRDISPADRRALESVIGQPLLADQQVVIEVVFADNRPQADEDAADDATQQIPEWWKVYEGLSDEEIDQLDAAVRKRADLTRIFE